MTTPVGAVGVLVAATGEPWEASALALVGARGSGLAVRRRCVDVPDLIAAARTGGRGVALVAAAAPGLDADTVDTVGRAGVGVVAVVPLRADDSLLERLRRWGAVVVRDDLEGLVEALHAADRDAAPDRRSSPEEDERPVAVEGARARRGLLLAVWGPSGAPGRTTVATGIAAALAAGGADCLLVDADPYGGAVAQHLGVLDEVSGLLLSTRAANAGTLDAASLAAAARQVSPGLRVLTGLPRADRWREVRPAPFGDVLETAVSLATHVVVDTGFSLEADGPDPFSAAPQRNGMTRAVLEAADEVVVVGAADPVGLARLARALVELSAALPGAAVRVVVNRTRPTLGWSETEVRGMVEGFHRSAEVSFLPEDRAAADRALMAGQSLADAGDSALARGLQVLAAAYLEPADGPPGRRSRRRRRRAQEPKSR